MVFSKILVVFREDLGDVQCDSGGVWEILV